MKGTGYQQLVEVNALSSRVKYLLDEGVSKLKRKKYSEALVNFKQCLELNPHSSQARSYLSITMTSLGDEQSAIEAAYQTPLNQGVPLDLGKLIQGVDTWNPEGLNYLNQELMKLIQHQDYPSAEKNFKLLTTASPNHPLTLHNLGLCLWMQGKWNEAIIYLSQAVKLDSHNLIFTKNLSLAFWDANQELDAINLLQNSTEILDSETHKLLDFMTQPSVGKRPEYFTPQVMTRDFSEPLKRVLVCCNKSGTRFLRGLLKEVNIPFKHLGQNTFDQTNFPEYLRDPQHQNIASVGHFNFDIQGDVLNQLEGNVKAMLLIKNPYDILISTSRYHAAYTPGREDLQADLENRIHKMNNQLQKFLKPRALDWGLSKKVLVVRYEDLMNHPLTEFKRIVDHFEWTVPITDLKQSIIKNMNYVGLDGELIRYPSLSSAKSHGPSRGRTGEFKSFLSTKDTKAISQQMKEFCDFFDYDINLL